MRIQPSYNQSFTAPYSFQDMEHDDEVAGEGNSYTAEFWQYDSRLGRRWNIDPIPKANESIYACLANNPIWFTDPTGADTTLYDKNRGWFLGTKSSPSEKTPIFVVDTDASNYDKNNPWKTAEPLVYKVGKDTENKGITGSSFRKNHPLYGKGTKAGSQVYEEDLMDMTGEFNKLIVEGLSVFKKLRGINSLSKDIAFYTLVTDDGLYDLKSKENDNTPSYAATVIGEWSLYGGTLRRYDDYGNISYGYFGTAAGYNRSELLEGSNTNQKGKDKQGLTNGNGDEFRDIVMMKIGIYGYWKLYNASKKKK